VKPPRRSVDVFLTPGKLVVCAAPTNIKTIVGSCVAVCLHDVARQRGGMNHYLLAAPTTGDEPDDRFGSVAVPRLIELMAASGTRPRDMRAFVIGGGHPVDVIHDRSIGDNNARIALEILRDCGIHVARQETGGDHGRKLLFSSGVGELIVRPVRGWTAHMAEVNRQ
jgi:chemotaxis protein CheD